MELQLVGGGRMGEALLAGWVSSGWVAADQVVVVEPAEARRQELADRYRGITVVDGPVACPAAVLAVKPHDITAVAAQVAELGARRVLSIAAGVGLAAIEAAVPAGVAVVRAMPNTPSLVGAGAAAIAAGADAQEADVAWARTALAAVGSVVVLPEAQLDAVTGLSGSGPAYVFLVAEALIEAGVLNGLARPVATELAIQTLVGSARMLAESSDGAEVLRHNVTSPGGTTAAGLAALERNGLRAAILDAVTAAVERSREMGSA